MIFEYLDKRALAKAILVLAGCVTQGCSSSAVSVTGYVQSLKTDDYDTPVEISLFDGKEDYVIRKNSKQKELLEYVDRKVAAEGSVSEDWDGKKQIEIDSYQLKD